MDVGNEYKLVVASVRALEVDGTGELRLVTKPISTEPAASEEGQFKLSV